MTNQNHTNDGPLLRESWIEDDADASFDDDLAGPSTPNRSRNTSRLRAQTAVTENWDDDFEDGTDSPRQPHAQRASTRVPPTPASMRSPARTMSNASQIENWDDEFQSTHNSPASRHDGGRRNHYVSDDEGDGEFGFDDRDEEDKTVTARSRGSTVGEESRRSPPPPLPVFIPPTDATVIQPFPRSPTASVFSVPHSTSARNSIAGYSTNSMTHLALHPTTSRASSLSSRGFAGLPPSPPIHKANRDRERRRLKKKSRPPGVGEGMYEMREVDLPEEDMDSYPPPFQLPTEETYRELTPPRSPQRGSISLPREDFMLPQGTATPEKRSSTPSPPPTSPPTKTPLLQRIGSVKKKFGVRRKRASTTPSEVAVHEGSHHDDLESTPRPTSSMSSTYQSSPTKQSSGLPSSGPSGSNWFFRSGGGGSSSSQTQSQPPQCPQKLTAQSRSSSGFSSTSTGLISGLRHQPSLERQLLQQTNGELPSKLVKRKSFGFVQIRKTIRPETGYDYDERERGGEVHDSKGKGRYGMLARARTPSHSSSSNANHGTDPSEEHLPAPLPNPTTPVPSGSRGFMGSVRRISMGERRSSAASHTHTRTKSSVSASDRARALGPELTKTRSRNQSRDPSVEGRRSFSGNAPSIRSSKGKEPASRRSSVDSNSKRGEGRNGLLPPIQLQTPASTLGRGTNRVSSRSGMPSGVIPALPPLPASIPAKGVQAASLGRSAIAPKLSSIPPGSNSALASAAAGRETGSGMRRNSLGDLKIPARITQAQSGLRRDLMMVKDFAASVGQLKDLQRSYHQLVTEVNSVLDSHHQAAQAAQVQAPPATPNAQATPRSISPNIFRRTRSNTNPQAPTSPPREELPTQQAYKQLVAAFYAIDSKYRISWECAELLVELGGGAVPEPGSAPAGPASSQSEPLMAFTPSSLSNEPDWAKHGLNPGRERAVTLSGNDGSRPVTPISLHGPTLPSSAGHAPPGANPTAQWRASTGRNDLSQRQLSLLKEMLNSPGSGADPANTMSPRNWDNSFEEGIPEEGRTPPPSSSPGGHGSSVNRDWRWGDAMNSTLTLPSEDKDRQFSSNRYDHHLRPAHTPGGGSLWMSKEDVSGGTSPQKKRRSSRLGMSGIRDMLRAIKKGAAWEAPSSTSTSRGYNGSGSNSSRATLPPPPPGSQASGGMHYLPSTTSLSTQSSNSQHNALHHLPKHSATSQLPPAPQSGRRRAKTSTEPQPENFKAAAKRPNSPYHSTSLGSMKASPRRPSLASIFKIGKSNKTLSSQRTRPDTGGDTSSDSGVGESLSPGAPGFRTSGSTGEEDWDKLEPVDYEAMGKAMGISKDGTATIRGLSGQGRGRSPYMQPNLPSDNPRRSSSRVASASQTSVAVPPLPTTPRRASASASQSQTSLHERMPIQPGSSGGPPFGSQFNPRLPRLSNVDELPSRPMNARSPSNHSSTQSQGQGQDSPRKASGRMIGLPSMKSGSVRSMPQGLVISDSTSSQQQHTLQHQSSSRTLALAMTPENIKPLLENAREVHVKLVDCINEIQALLDLTKQKQYRAESAPMSPGLLSPPLTVASAHVVA